MTSIIEAVLFASVEPMKLSQIASACNVTPHVARQALSELEQALFERGIRLSHFDGAYQLVTAPNAAPTLESLGQTTVKADFSPAALETLAIIAYEGPLTRSAVEARRGVSSDSSLRWLLARDLIAEAGKSHEPGKPMTYGVTHTFLSQFGLANLSDLPTATDPPKITTQARHAN